MRKRLFTLVAMIATMAIMSPQLLLAQEIKPVKNVIIMIADGTSLSSISLARWYQRLQDEDKQSLHLDPYMSGTIFTFNSNAPIGDSAPTTSTYMNGVPSIQGFVGTYPYSCGEDDLVELDPSMEYRPIISLMEATKLLQNRKIGLVMTSEFPHATPADATAHTYARNRYDWIIPQMVHNNIDVLIGGGAGLISNEQVDFLKSKGYAVFKNDHSSLSGSHGDKVWSLFSHRDIPYDLDAKKGEDPRIDEMVESAIRHLDNPNGFFLLIEGSKIDWAAHANDPVGIASEMVAFDRAVGVALDFAKQDGNTIVVLTSDHGNSGISIGRRDLRNYAGASKSELFGPLAEIKKTSVGLAQLIAQNPESEIATIIEREAGFAPSEKEIKILNILRELELSDDDGRVAIRQKLKSMNLEELGESALYTGALSDFIAALYRSKMYIGFTTNGHTGEETFLATYAPTQEQRLMGVHTNIGLHNYMRQALGLENSMLELTEEYFAPHTEVFSGMKFSISGTEATEKILTVKHKGVTLSIPAYSTQAKLNGTTYELPIPAVYVDKKDTFYLPAALRSLLKP